MERYTEEQNEFIRLHGAEMTTDELYVAVNEQFGCLHTKQSVRTHTKKLGVTKSKDTIRRAKKQSQSRPIGTVTVVNGFKYIKVKDEFEPFYKNYVPLHRHVWENNFGKIPEGYSIVFLNGDKLDCNAENLACVSNAILARMANGHGKSFWSEDREVTKTAILVCDLDCQLEADGI